MFAITYVCEKLFSTMKIVKTKFRSRLTDKYLRDQLRLTQVYVILTYLHLRFAERKTRLSRSEGARALVESCLCRRTIKNGPVFPILLNKMKIYHKVLLMRLKICICFPFYVKTVRPYIRTEHLKTDENVIEKKIQYIHERFPELPEIITLLKDRNDSLEQSLFLIEQISNLLSCESHGIAKIGFDKLSQAYLIIHINPDSNSDMRIIEDGMSPRSNAKSCSAIPLQLIERISRKKKKQSEFVSGSVVSQSAVVRLFYSGEMIDKSVESSIARR
ncbi:hypothetical protein ANN_11262 [Periplaneta americana]|uniref:Uncharacterized protein n=1 Tax=Periplaneta americana TaxID=6978 RepID=A0ABQ8T677_PERAM|nr:hypothetical protein ANN_11262 [Periplaneta americana]